MKKCSFMAVGAAVLLACGSALAGTATFSGTTGDTDVQLTGVVYDQCNFVLNPGVSTDVASALSVFPLISDVPGTITLDLVDNDTPGGYVGIEIGLRNALFEDDGSITVKLSSTEVWIDRSIGGSTEEVGGDPVAADGATTLQVEITESELIVRVDTGAGLADAVTLNLANFGTDNEDVTADRILNLRLLADGAGPAWNVNRLTWAGDPVPDTNGPGCQLVTIPNVVGLTQSEATAALQAAGFFEVTVEFDGDVDSPTPGEVVSQDPAGDTLGPVGPMTIVLGGVAFLNDSDEDGLDDDWELEHFGNLDQGRWDDPDGDKFWNIREFENDTDPNNPESRVPVTDYSGLLMLALLLGAVGILAAVRMGRGIA